MRTTKPLGHKINLSALRAELHVLLAVFLASRQIALIAAVDHFRDASLYQFADCEDETITKILLNSAIAMRVLDDQEERRLDESSTYCGTLTKKSSRSADSCVGLTLREACNKIIHATAVEVDRGVLEAGGQHLNPYLYLTGNDKGKTWQANIDVSQYVREALHAIKSLA